MDDVVVGARGEEQPAVDAEICLIVEASALDGGDEPLGRDWCHGSDGNVEDGFRIEAGNRRRTDVFNHGIKIAECGPQVGREGFVERSPLWVVLDDHNLAGAEAEP